MNYYNRLSLQLHSSTAAAWIRYSYLQYPKAHPNDLPVSSNMASWNSSKLKDFPSSKCSIQFKDFPSLPCLITVSHYLSITAIFADGRTSIYPIVSQCFSHFPMFFSYFIGIFPAMLTAVGFEPGSRHSHHVGPLPWMFVQGDDCGVALSLYQSLSSK